MFEMRPTPEVVQIVRAGGGLEMRAAMKTTADLIQIAAAAKASGTTVWFRDLHMRPTAEIVQIAMAGGGRVVFADKAPG